MSLRAKIVILVLGLTTAILAGLGLFLAGSWGGWSEATVERDLAERAAAIAALVELKKDGRVKLEAEESPVLRDPGHPFRLLAPGGAVLGSGDLAWPPGDRGRGDQWTDSLRDAGGRTWRVVSRVLSPAEDERRDRREPASIVVQVAGPEAPFQALELRFQHGLLAALLAALLLGGAGAAALAHLSLGPLRRLAAEVDAIGASSLDRRISTAGLDPELGRLAAAFNEMLARLDAAMRQQRRFVSRASHALRTPTTTILTRAEVSLRREREPAEYRGALLEIATAARESASLVGHLLTLARLDEQGPELRKEDVSLAAVARELSRLLAPRAAEAGVAIEVDVPEGLRARAEPASLRELLEALLDNALLYTPRGGRAGVRAVAVPEGAALTVWDTGPGIPSEERASALDRFFRGGAAQASGKPGSGLGLAIVKSIADAHGAALSLGERTGGGLEVVVTLPA